MKVVVLSSLAFSLVNFRRALLTAMVEAGHDVIACAPEDDDGIRQVLAAAGVRYHRTPMQRTNRNPFADLLTLASYIRLFRSERPDVVLAYTQKPIIYGGIAARIARGMPFHAMVSGLGYVFTDDGGKPRLLLRAAVAALYRQGVRRARTIFVFNRDDREELLRHNIIEPQQNVVQVPGSGIDLAAFQSRPVPAGPPVFLLIARLLGDKGLFEYVEAGRRVRALHPEVRVQFLGPLDPNPAAISREQLDSWIAEGVIEYLGETRDVTPYLAAATVYVLPSYREGLPRTVLEAMSTGRAIITTDAPGCREPVTQGQNGFLVPVRDPAALAEAMLRFVHDPALARRMGAQSRLIAESRYDVGKVNMMLLTAMGLNDAPPRPETPAAAGNRGVRRFVDVAVAGSTAVITLPLMALIGLAIGLTMGGPILFTQLRAGKDNRPFRLVKFRTMTDARNASGRLLPDAARMTALGRLLRRTRLDELPEVLNILKGEMSLIGPRPLLPETVEAMGAAGIRRGLVPPGLTGWAQVNGNARLEEADKLALDLWYIDHASPRLNLLILLKTLGVVILGDRINRSEVGRAYAGGDRRRG